MPSMNVSKRLRFRSGKFFILLSPCCIVINKFMQTLSPKTPQKNYLALWFIVYFGLLLQGFKSLLQYYLQQDRLSFGYFFLLGIPGAQISLSLNRTTSHRNFAIKIVVIIILLAIVTLTNIEVRSYDNF